jgi:WD40 repeat protein
LEFDLVPKGYCKKGLNWSAVFNFLDDVPREVDVNQISTIDCSELLKFRNTNAIMSISFSPDGKSLAIGSSTSAVIISVTGEKLLEVTHPHDEHSNIKDDSYDVYVCFSPDGKLLATSATYSTCVFVSFLSTGYVMHILKGVSRYGICGPERPYVVTNSGMSSLR